MTLENGTVDAQRSSKLYLLAWGSLGLVAMIYLGVLFARSGLNGFKHGLATNPQVANSKTQVIAKTAAELKGLRANVAGLKSQLATLRAQQARSRKAKQQAKRSLKPKTVKPKNLASQPVSVVPAFITTKTPIGILTTAIKNPLLRVAKKSANAQVKKNPTAAEMVARFSGPATIANKPSGWVTTSSRSTQNAKSTRRRSAKSATRKTSRAPGSSRPGYVKPTIIAPFIDAFGGDGKTNAAPTKKMIMINTGSIAPAQTKKRVAAITRTKSAVRTTARPKPRPVIAFGKAVVERPRQPIALHLVTAPTIEGLRLTWLALSDQYQAGLTHLTPHYVAIGRGAKQQYRLLAGPVSSKTEATRLCKQIATQNLPCAIAALHGNKL